MTKSDVIALKQAVELLASVFNNRHTDKLGDAVWLLAMENDYRDLYENETVEIEIEDEK